MRSGTARPSVEADLTAAVLYAGPGAMLSHSTALWWRGLIDRQPWPTQVEHSATVPIAGGRAGPRAADV